MTLDRSKLIQRVHRHLEARGWPRVVLFVIVALSGVAGFLVSFALLSAGVTSMAWRYGLAAGTGYVAFLCLLALYVAWQRRLGDFGPEEAVDLAQWMDLRLPTGGGSPQPAHFSGGRSGGGGSSSSWDGSSTSAEGSSWFDADIDAIWILVALAALAGAGVAVGYVLWIAPALLAEVLVDAIIVGTVSKQMGLLERRDWTATVLRRTWIPATLMILMLVISGWALQQAVPEARSIGPAAQALMSR